MDYDIAVIGGGINGVGIAADAAGRGLKVLLCEAEDLGGGTSSASSKLIHGGLRYLESFEFSLVRKALQEREILWKRAPHLVWPLRFVMPYRPQLRPAWMIRLGLWLYDHLSTRHHLPGSKQINLANDPRGDLFKPELKTAFCYSDCWVDDSRFVLANAQLARQKGATILSRTACIDAKRFADHWQLHLKRGDSQWQVSARCVVNAAGPWVDKVQSEVLGSYLEQPIERVQGSHIVVPRLYQGDHAYLLQHRDKRIIFLLPFDFNTTLIGTTDVALQEDPWQAKITPNEIDYLLDVTNAYLKHPVRADQIRWQFTGVRPLIADANKSASKLSRDYRLEWQQPSDQAPLLAVVGGKITTYRVLAEQAVNQLNVIFPELGGAWTASYPLPGALPVDRTFETFFQEQKLNYPFLSDENLFRLCRAYGSQLTEVLQGCQSLAALGKHYGHGLYQQEVSYLVENEWAQTAEDILWRRSKLGLCFDDAQVDDLKNNY